jgi:hypothetical protein
MEEDRTDSKPGGTGTLALASAYRDLNERRNDIERRIGDLPPNDAAWNLLWRELDSVLQELSEVVKDLARHPTMHLSDLRAKAGVLTDLLGVEEKSGSLVISDGDKLALARSFAKDLIGIAKLTGAGA